MHLHHQFQTIRTIQNHPPQDLLPLASIPGWDIYLRQPELDGDTYDIGGFQVPLDDDIPVNSNESQSASMLNNLSNIIHLSF